MTYIRTLRRASIWQALVASARTKINRANFIDEINQVTDQRGRYSKSESDNLKEFRLLTTISIKPPFKFSNFTIDDCSIRVIEGSFPKKYDSRKDFLTTNLFASDDRETNDDDEKQYCKVIVSTESSYPQEASVKCLAALNLLRAWLCMQYNSSMLIPGRADYVDKPLNKIILGKYTTLHTERGKLAIELYWINAPYVRVKPFHMTTEYKSIIKKQTTAFCNQLDKIEVKDRKKIKTAMLRFVRACDHTNYYSTIIEGWGSLESLLVNKKNSNDLISKRCSFIFEKNKLEQQIIESIREYRNRIVHDRELPATSLIVCYQLQRIFYKIITFYLDYADEFDTLEKANEFLDLPPDIAGLNELQKELHNKQQLIQRAIKYLTPSKE